MSPGIAASTSWARRAPARSFTPFRCSAPFLPRPSWASGSRPITYWVSFSYWAAFPLRLAPAPISAPQPVGPAPSRRLQPGMLPLEGPSAPRRLPAGARRNIEQTGGFKLGPHRGAVERFYHVVVGAGGNGARDIWRVMLRRAVDDEHLFAVGHGAQRGEELHRAHTGHMVVEHDCIRHGLLTAFDRLLAVL